MAYGGADDQSFQTIHHNGLMSSEDQNGESDVPDLLSNDLTFSAMLEQIVEGTDSSSNAKSSALSSLDSEVVVFGGFKSRTELYEFKRQQLEAFHNDSWSWKFLNEFLRVQISESRYADLDMTIKKFQDTSKELLGKEVDTTQIQAGVVYLVKTLRGTKYISNEQKHQLKMYFGDYNETPMNRAVNLVEALEKMSVMKIIKWNELDSPPKSEDLMDKPFGAGITLTPFNGVFPSVRCFLDENERPQLAENSVQNGEVVYSLEWLIGQLKPKYSVKEQSLGLGVSEMASAVMELLKCKLKSNEDLQSELVELLGFDLIELVIEILAHRDAIVLGQDEASARAQIESSSALSRGNHQKTAIDPEVLKKFLPKMPGNNNSGCQIVVQSEEEKELKKIVRKEEKRFKRLMGQNKEFEEEQKGVSRSYAANQMRLAASQTQPVIKYATPEVHKYPHVYDLKLEIAQKSTSAGGFKIMLPLDTKYNSDDIKEEVCIPSSKPPPTDVGKDRVQITSLPKYAQAAFKGFKQLNLIQSVVYPAALLSGENLLISAPTGAGKTNIALLTILHEVGLHVKGDVLEKKDFKIVYVAPMKALAAEMTENFGKRLAPLGLSVKELTGDMQLSKTEIMKTQMLVTTPEKWDVVTRKSSGDVSLVQSVKLLIIDEVHLLHEDRGSVIETLVARTLRQIESTQSRIRLVALSATLPNYLDVARFLRVNCYKGLFYFDSRFRPVPLSQTFVGIKSTNIIKQLMDLDDVCYEKVKNVIDRRYQCMVFVHSRSGTVKTAQALLERARSKGETDTFLAETWTKDYNDCKKEVEKSRNKELRELFPHGFAMHHAGMLRQDRNIVEKNFAKGNIRVLVCTATLAWGVNLPAHAVVIKGTQYYDAQKSSFVDIGILDVLQIFGRAGRPQYDTYGEAYILTAYNKLSHYLNLLTRQTPIESQYVESLIDHLNAEIVLGTVNTIDDAVQWLSYTYLFVRMKQNPLVYAVDYNDFINDPDLLNHRRQIVEDAAKRLDDARMIRYVKTGGTGFLYPTDLGRTASHFYINFHTIECINENMNGNIFETEILKLISMANEFVQVKVRDEELDELSDLMQECWYDCAGGAENNHGKVNILLQSYVNRIPMTSFSLTSDQLYISTNASRICRALFEIALKNNWANATSRLLSISKCIEQKLWEQEHPLRQLPGNLIREEVLVKLDRSKLSLDRLLETPAKEISSILRLNPAQGERLKELARSLPSIKTDASVQPITRSVLRVKVLIQPMFTWNDKVSGISSEPFWLWVEDPETNYIYHSEYISIGRKNVVRRGGVKPDPVESVFTIPIHEPLPTQYLLRIESDRWVGCGIQTPVSFRHLILPEQHPPHTELLDLEPIPKSCLGNKQWEDLFSFSHFNPVQTQIFHTMYYTDCNVLLGAPTGSGKTIAAEIAFFKVFRDYPDMKVVYIAPLKALVRERVKDWKVRMEQRLGKLVVELTGDVVPDSQAISAADIIVTTPEKWDGVSRSWQTRHFVRSVALIVIDEIHLLGDDRGPVLEVIVSRTNFISSNTDKKVRVIGLSTALANARDLADWLGIKTQGLFNFKPAVRPVPLQIHISGFAGRHYCPRMASMNKPAYQQIRTHSPNKPVLIFVSSRRQTRLTALDLVAFLVAENAKQWLHCSQEELETYLCRVKETNLKLLLAFGIGIHHAGLTESDRNIVEEMFVSQKIQVLIATATLAWGVNFPAHLVIVKGTEYYDGKSKKYQLMPITDVLQMIGRAGRPQFDTTGKAVVFVHDVHKNFYKKFLYEPFPVESSLLSVLSEHLNAEIIAGTITSKQDAIEYITWTYFFRRLLMNPGFYGMDGTEQDQVNVFLSSLIEKSLQQLTLSNCVQIAEDEMELEPQVLGKIASYYYVSHLTVRMFSQKAEPNATLADIMKLLTDATEYNELPVRHNEDALNADLAKLVPIEVNQYTYDDPHTKALLLLQAHFTRCSLPCSDYLTDTKSVLDQSIRILQALLDCVADLGWLTFSLKITQIIQMIVQGLWLTQSAFLQLPHVDNFLIGYLAKEYRRHVSQWPIKFNFARSLPELMLYCRENYRSLKELLQPQMKEYELDEFFKALQMLPIVDVKLAVSGFWSDDPGNRKQKPVIVVDPTKSKHKDSSIWIDVHADQEYLIEIDLKKLNRCPRNAYSPKFPKPKPAGWFFVLGDTENQELLALKRLTSLRPQQSISLSFFTPEETGKCIYTLYVMSDSYLGLDQQYSLHLNVVEACMQTQLETELTELDDDDEDDDSNDAAVSTN